MGRISGVLWVAAALVGAVRQLPARRPARGPRLGPRAQLVVLLYGLGSVTGAIPWERASMRLARRSAWW